MYSISSKTFLLFLSVLSTSIINAQGIEFQHLTFQEGIEKATKEDKPILIDVFATWCGPCKYLSNTIFQDEELATYMNQNYICLKFDGDKDEGLAIIGGYNVDAYPTMLLLASNGDELDRIKGAYGSEWILKKAKIARKRQKNTQK